MTPPITALGSRYGIQGALGRSVKRAAAGGTWWDLNGTITSCVAAYQPKGAASYAASLTDLSGNSNDATEVSGSEPGWGASTGWTFNGSQHLKSVNDTVCVFIRMAFTGTKSNENKLWGVTGAADCYIGTLDAISWAICNYESSRKTFNTTVTSGVIGYSGSIPYVDGSAIGSGLGSGGYAYPCGIGTCLTKAGAVYTARWVGSIQAIGVYNAVLDSTQVGNLSTAMAAL